MIPPSLMVTNKKRGSSPPMTWAALLGVLWLSGCGPPGPNALLKGDRLNRQGDYAAATEALEKAVELLPQDARAWNHLGLAYHGAGRPSDAARAYQQALRLDRNLIAGRYNLGCLHLEQNNIPAALAEFTSFVGLQPNAAEGWAKLGRAQLRASQFEAADQSFRRALQLNARLAEAWNGMGMLQAQRRRDAEALQCFGAALREQPEYAPALLNLAIVSHQHSNHRAQALQKYREYLELDPPPPERDAVQRMARQLERELHPPEPPPATSPPPIAMRTTPSAASPATNKPAPPSEAVSAPAITEKPAPAPQPPVATSAPPVVAEPAPRPRVEQVRVTGNETFIVARDVAPNAASSMDPRASAAPGNDPAPSATSGSRAGRYPYRSLPAPRAGNRDEAQRLLAQGVLSHQQFRLAEAIEHYRKAAQADSSYFEAWYNLGVGAYEAGDTAQCLTAYENALAIVPDSLKARYNFAVALERANYPFDAALELEKLLAAHADEARAHLTLANLCAERLGQPDKARTHYLRFLVLDPQHPQATPIRYWLEANP